MGGSWYDVVTRAELEELELATRDKTLAMYSPYSGYGRVLEAKRRLKAARKAVGLE